MVRGHGNIQVVFVFGHGALVIGFIVLFCRVVMIYLCIVVPGDIPIYELQIGLDYDSKKEDVNQFIVHAALDIVDQKIWTSPAMYLKQVDRFNDLLVSAYVTASYTKFMLLHGASVDETLIGSFFTDLYDAYLKVQLNPFHEKTSPITSQSFTTAVKFISDKYFPRT